MSNYDLRNWVDQRSLFIFFFLVVNVGLYFPSFLTLLSLSQFLLFILAFILGLRSVHSILPLLDLRVSIFFVYIFASIAWAHNFSFSVDELANIFKSVLISYFFGFIVVAWRAYEKAMFSLAISSIVYGLYFYLNSDASAFVEDRSLLDDSELANVNTVSFIVALSMAYFLNDFLSSRKFISLALVVIAVVLVGLMGSRKSFLMIVACGTYLIYNYRSVRNVFVIISLAGILIPVVMIALAENINVIFDRFVGILDFSGIAFMNRSDEIRLELIDYGVNLIIDNFLLGTGFNSFAAHYLSDFGEVISPHNTFIEVLVGLGFVGFLIYYSVYWHIFKYSIKLDRVEMLYNRSVLLALLIGQIWMSVVQVRFVWIILILMLIRIHTTKSS